MSYYNVPQTYSHTYTNSHDYSNNRHWGNSNWNNHRYGNGWTAMNWAKKWYPGWNAFHYRWHNNCWWVYMRQGHHYRTVCIGSNYNWHWYQNGYRW